MSIRTPPEQPNAHMVNSDASVEAARRESEVLARLQSDLRNDRLAIIIGAGVTLSATADASGNPLSRITWTGLIQNGLDFLLHDGYEDRSDCVTKQAYEALDDSDTDSLLEAADILSSQLKKHSLFPTWLQSVFGSLQQDIKHPAILETLKKLHENGAILLTTNYDDILEKYCDLKHIRRSKIEDIVKFRRGNLDGVFHIHGSYHDPQEVVLNTTDYYQIRQSDEVQNMLKAFLDDKTILFVGCGSGLEDPNFDGLLKWAADRQKNIPNIHCLLVRDDDPLACKPLLRVRYGPNYHDLAPYLNKLLHDHQAEPLRRLARDASEAIAKPKREPFSTVPFSRDPDFVDRPDVLTWIHEKLARPAARTGLVGLGGVGKSQLAIEYSFKIRERSPQTWVFWVHGSTEARFEEAYRGIADRLELPERHDPKTNVFQLIRDWLCDEVNGQWIMILDNVDNVEVFHPGPGRGQDSELPLAAYLPQSHNGSILITSRSRDAAARLTGSYKNVKEIQAMDAGQGLQLLRNKLEDGANENEAADLLYVLDYIPLAITQAAAYINRRGPRMKISSYLDEFRKNDNRKKAKLSDENLGDLRRDPSAYNSVISTWRISFEQIREERLSAADLLSLMSFFNPQAIPEWVLRRRGRTATESDDEMDGKDEDQKEADEALVEDLETLRAFSLVTATAEDDIWEMHPLVQFCARVWLSSFDDVERWREKFVALISDEFPNGTFENWSICQQLFPHAEPLFNYKTADEGLLKQWAGLLTRAAWYMWMKGNYKAARDTVVKAIDVRERLLGRDDLDTLASISILALVLRYQGKYEKSEEMSRWALDGCEKTLGKDHLNTLISINNLAMVLRDQGKYEESEEMDRRALKGREKALGKDHPDTLTSINNLALVLQYQGKYEESEKMNRRALKGKANTLGKDHPDTLMSISNLATVLQDQGKYEESEKMNRWALKGYEKVLGKDHFSTLTSISNLALVLRYQGKYEESEELNRWTLTRRENVLGKDHPDTLISISNLALVLQNQRKYEESEELNRLTLKKREKVLGKDHPNTLMSINNLATVLQDQEKYEESEEMNRRALEGREKVLGKDHRDTLMSVGNLAYLYHQQRRYDNASELYQRACDGYKRVLGAQHPATVGCWAHYSRMVDEMGQ